MLQFWDLFMNNAFFFVAVIITIPLLSALIFLMIDTIKNAREDGSHDR